MTKPSNSRRRPRGSLHDRAETDTGQAGRKPKPAAARKNTSSQSAAIRESGKPPRTNRKRRDEPDGTLPAEGSVERGTKIKRRGPEGLAAGSRTPRRVPRAEPESSIGSASENETLDRLQKISGVQAVTALFARDPDRVVRLYYSEAMKSHSGKLCAQMAAMHRAYRLLDEADLQKVAGTVLHGGIVAAARPRKIPEIDGERLALWAQLHKPLIILDGIGNPNNLGAIARTMVFFGLEHLLLTRHPEQAGLSDSAYRVAEGALEFLQIGHLADGPRLLGTLKRHYWLVGTVLEAGAPGIEGLTADRSRPVALVLGNEENGLRQTTRNQCDRLVTIATRGPMQSLNVSVTAAILIHALVCGGAQPNQPRRTGRQNTGRTRSRPQPKRPGYR